MSETSDSNMDEILASIRRIIAEDPIGTRPNPATIRDGSNLPPASLPLPPRTNVTAEQRIEPSLPPLRAPGTEPAPVEPPAARAEPKLPPPPPVPQPPATGQRAAQQPVPDIDDIFDGPPAVVPSRPAGPGKPAASETLRNDAPTAQKPPVPVPSPPPVRATSPMPPPPAAPPAPKAEADLAELPKSGTGPITIAAMPTNETDVENLLSRLALSLSAQASAAPTDDVARKTVADAVAAVAASAPKPAEPKFEVIAETPAPAPAAKIESPSAPAAPAKEPSSPAGEAMTPAKPAVVTAATSAASPAKAAAPAVSPSPAPATAPAKAEAVKPAASPPATPAAASPAKPAVPAAKPAAPPVIAAKPARSLEDSVSEMLRPLLKQWLDVHMPAMLEKALREELASRLPDAIAKAEQQDKT